MLEHCVPIRAPSLGDGAPAVITPPPHDVWHEVLASDPDALLSQTPEWIAALCRDGIHEDASRLYELPGGRRVVLPMVRRRGLPPALTVEASLPPAWGIGGIVAPGGARPADVAAVFRELSGRCTLQTSLTPNPLQAQAWAAARPPRTVTVPRLAHVLSLEDGFDRVWSSRFTGSARTAVRKAQRSGLTIERSTDGGLVPVFLDLYQRSLRRWAHRQHEPLALARFRARVRDPADKLRAMASLGEIWVAFKDGMPAAAILVLQAAAAHYTRGAMDERIAGPTRANYLLHSLAIEAACISGCRHYHMGETGGSKSLAQFKTRFGARAYPYAAYHLERLPLTTANRRLRSAVKRTIGFKDLS
ncbi:MAG: GNAT family N-acetyltransferase [Solirubrobacteraceae bacterium]